MRFVRALNSTAFEFLRSHREGRAGAIAWSARNFLGLSIWIDYCCVSEGIAKRFREDSVRDMYGLVASVLKDDMTADVVATWRAFWETCERFSMVLPGK